MLAAAGAEPNAQAGSLPLHFLDGLGTVRKAVSRHDGAEAAVAVSSEVQDFQRLASEDHLRGLRPAIL
eukprot:10384125-Alexandrium_andersonii.AAC.1